LPSRNHLARVWGLAPALVLALCLAGALGCNTLMAFDRSNNFEEAQGYFTQYVRFGQIAHASRYVAADQREAFLAIEPELTSLRFTDYDIIAIKVDDDARAATVDVRWTGYMQQQMVERTVDVTQKWVLDDDEGWQVHLELDKIQRVLAGKPATIADQNH
jgi:hypothetical protein